MPGITEKIRQKINQGKQAVKTEVRKESHEVKERVNPWSSTNRKARQERKTEQAELRKTEQEAYKKELKVQAEERAKRRAKHEYGNEPQTKSAPTSTRKSNGAVFNKRNVPEYREPYTFVAPDMWGNIQKAKPKPQQEPTETTTVRQNGQTITIKKKVAQNTNAQQQATTQPQYNFPDILGGFTTNRPIKTKGKFQKETKPFDPFEEWMQPIAHQSKKGKKGSKPFDPFDI